ncbi:MAG: NTP transferase domain-containing protein [Actinomycetota bacterium]
MIFGEVRIEEAEGLILAHSLRLAHAMLKKGRVLTAEDVAALKAEGINFVTGARLEDDDVAENEAASLLAHALAGDGVAVSSSFVGRCNLFAATGGVVDIDRERLDRLNLVDEAVTVATVMPYDIVAPRQMVTTVKIIPFGVDRRVIETCEVLATRGGPLVSVRPFGRRSVALVMTTLPGLREAVLEGTAAVTRARVEAMDGELALELRCPHDVGSIERTLRKAVHAGVDLVLVAGASATVDRRDVVPSAIVRAGGAIEHFGMPVDPGNLLLLARIGIVPVVNLPGCGRSPKPNGLDWVLRRLMAGIAVRPEDVMRMGAGGLLKEHGQRHSPAERVGMEPSAVVREARIAGIVLAAGASSRMGANKLLAEVGGKAMVAHAVEAAMGAGLDPVVVVTGSDADAVEEALPPCEVLIVRNPDPDRGMASSLGLGVAALPDDVDAAVVLLADMPRVGAHQVVRLKAPFDPDEGRAICVPVHKGRRGNPVLFGRQFFAELQRLAGDKGGKQLLADHGELVFEVVMDDDAVLADVDTPEDLAAAQA